MSVKIYLPVTDDIEGCAILVPADGNSLLKGNDDENLACGECKKVLARGVSTRTLYDKFVVDKALLIKCPCGAHNKIPAQIRETKGT